MRCGSILIQPAKTALAGRSVRGENGRIRQHHFPRPVVNAPVSFLPKGTALIRYIRALARGKGNLTEAAAIAAELWGVTAAPARFLRAASGAGSIAGQ